MGYRQGCRHLEISTKILSLFHKKDNLKRFILLDLLLLLWIIKINKIETNDALYDVCVCIMTYDDIIEIILIFSVKI